MAWLAGFQLNPVFLFPPARSWVNLQFLSENVSFYGTLQCRASLSVHYCNFISIITWIFKVFTGPHQELSISRDDKRYRSRPILYAINLCQRQPLVFFSMVTPACPIIPPGLLLGLVLELPTLPMVFIFVHPCLLFGPWSFTFTNSLANIFNFFQPCFYPTLGFSLLSTLGYDSALAIGFLFFPSLVRYPALGIDLKNNLLWESFWYPKSLNYDTVSCLTKLITCAVAPSLNGWHPRCEMRNFVFFNPLFSCWIH